MNFFESQERAHKNTTLLIVLFGAAVIALIAMANLLILVVFGVVNSQQMREGQSIFAQMDWKLAATVGAGISVVVLVGSLYKMTALSAGGKVVAETLGGQLIPRNTEEPNQRKLLNVVDEMAIASGTPAPPVYLRPLVVSCGTQQSESVVVVEPGGHVGRLPLSLSTCPRGGCQEHGIEHRSGGAVHQRVGSAVAVGG